MALSLGDFITAAEAKAMLDQTKAVQLLKVSAHQTILSVASGVTSVIFPAPKFISNAAKTALEAEGYTVTIDVLPSGEYDNLNIDWSNA